MRALQLSVASLVALAACDSPPTPPDETPAPEVVYSEADPWRLGTSIAPEVLSGTVVIQTSPDGAVIVALDGGKHLSFPDGKVDFVAVLQTDGPLREPVRMRLANARLRNLDRGVVISTPDRRSAIGLAVRAMDGSDPLRVIRGRIGTVWEGIGLSRRTGRWGLEGGYLPDSAMDWILSTSCSLRESASGADLDESSTICDSGGPGATSCSTSCGSDRSCSVTCDSDYYACCDKGSCSCTCKGVD